MIRIIVRMQDSPDLVKEIDKQEITIGRSKNSDIFLSDSRLSRHHCSIVREGEDYFVIDKGSSNGTFLNMKRISREKIRTQDVISTGLHTLFIEEIPDGAEKYVEFAKSLEKDGLGQKLLGVEETPEVTKAEIVPDAPKYVLEIVEGEGKSTVHSLSAKKTTIGRNEQNSIIIKDSLASNFHAEIIPDGENYTLHDLGSTNGTRLNGQKVIKAPLFSGCEINIGDIKLVYKNIGKPTDQDISFASRNTPHARMRKLEKKGSKFPFMYLISAIVIIGIIIAAVNMLPDKNGTTPVVSNTPPVVSENLIKDNPSFDGDVAADATPMGWLFSDIDKTTNVFVDKAKSRTGTQSLAFKNIGDGKDQLTLNVVTLAKDISVQGGKSYKASAYILSENSIGFNAIRVRAYNSSRDSIFSEYCTIPVSRTHTDFVLSECSFVAPMWADTLSVTCLAFGSRGSVWFDDISLLPLSEEVNASQARISIDSSNKLVVDSFGNYWFENAQGRFLGSGGSFEIHCENSSLPINSNLFASTPVLEVLEKEASIRISGDLVDVSSNSHNDFIMTYSSRDGKCAVNAVYTASANKKVSKITSTFNILENSFPSGVRVASMGKLFVLDNENGKYENIEEVLFGAGNNAFSMSFPFAMSLSAVLENGIYSILLSTESKPEENAPVFSVLLSKDSIAMKAYIEGILAKAGDLLKSGSLVEAKGIYEKLLEDYPESNIVKSDSERAFQEISKYERELSTELKSLLAQVLDAAKTVDLTNFESSYDDLKRLVEKIHLRLPGTSLAKKADAAIEESTKAFEGVIKEMEDLQAEKLLTLANEAFEEGKTVLCKVIIENLLRKFPESSSAPKAKALLVRVQERLELLKQAVKEWDAVLETVQKHLKKGETGQAKKVIQEFLTRFPDFQPAKEHLESLN